MIASENEYHHHGPMKLACGVTLPDAVTAYRTYGDPKKPCILFPTRYAGHLEDQLYLVGSGKALDTDRYFVVTFAVFSNGESSSPSNTPSPYNGPNFPVVRYEDSVRAQYEVVTNVLGVKKLFAVVGFSAGGQQAYHWAVMYPDFTERIVVMCSAARTSEHSRAMKEGAIAALVNSKDFEAGNYTSIPVFGLKAFARVFAPWFFTPTWFAKRKYASAETPNFDAWLKTVWEPQYLEQDANDFLRLLDTWYSCDISLLNDGDGDLGKMLSKIKAKALIVPAKGDMLFPPEHSEAEAACIPGSKFAVIDTIWGHLAGGGALPEGTAFLTEQIRIFFEET